MPYKTEELTPTKGGILSPNLSAEKTGVRNYVRKVQLRRSFDKEIRREGDAFFKPTRNDPYIDQAYPCRDENNLPIEVPITQIHAAINPNGLDLTIVATPTKLLSMIRTTNAFYFNKPNTDADYFGAAIIKADTALKEFRVPNDWTDNNPNPFLAGYTIQIVESAANDGVYTVAADAVYDGGADETVITVLEVIPADFTVGALAFDGVINELRDDVGVDVSEHLYYFERFDRWVELATGFSEEGHRWEIETLGNFTVFNNGVDPLYILDLRSFRARPIYELREQGIVRVDTIGQFNGVLMLGNVTELDSDDLEKLMIGADPTNPDPYGAYDSFTTEVRTQFKVVTGVQSRPDKWAPSFIGSIAERSRLLILRWRPLSLNIGDELVISGAGVLGGDLITKIFAIGVPTFAPRAPDVPGTGYTTTTDVPTFSDGKGFGLTVDVVEVAGEITLITINQTGNGYLAGEVITIDAGGQDATMTIGFTDATGITIGEKADRTIEDRVVQKLENLSLAPNPASYELLDKSDAVLRIIAVRDRVAIFKSNSIFIGQPTGDVVNPFNFTQTYRGDRTPFWRWTVVNIEEDYVVYAGANAFYRYNLTTQKPTELPKLSIASKLFLDNSVIAEMEQVYAFNCDVTREVWFMFPAAEKLIGIGGLAWDVRFNSVSEIDHYYTAGTNARIERNEIVEEEPSVRDRNRVEETVTLLGETFGAIKIYGRTNEPRSELGGKEKLYVRGALFTDDTKLTQVGTTVTSDLDFFGAEMVGRFIMWPDKSFVEITAFVGKREVTVDSGEDQAAVANVGIYVSEYDSWFLAGWGSFKTNFNEKDLRSYVLLGGSDNETSDMRIQLYGTTNPNDDEDEGLVCEKILSPMIKQNFLPAFLRFTYLRDKVTISGRCDASISGRLFEIAVRKSRSIVRS